MIFAIDCGNTRIKWGLYEAGRWRSKGYALLRDPRADAFERLGGALVPGIDRVVVANVAGAETAAAIAAVVGERIGVEPEIVAVAPDACGIRTAYAEPGTLGVDRWVAMIAARSIAAGLVCVVNAGTAVTFDAVDPAGAHLGGLILPGARLMIGALAAQTSQIALSPPPAEQVEGLAVLGRSTEAAVGHGAWLAIAGAVDRAARIVAHAFAATPRLVIGGGDAEVLAAWLESEAAVRPDLVLEGLARIASERGQARA
jgi:type III pantothenate kinase